MSIDVAQDEPPDDAPDGAQDGVFDDAPDGTPLGPPFDAIRVAPDGIMFANGASMAVNCVNMFADVGPVAAVGRATRDCAGATRACSGATRDRSGATRDCFGATFAGDAKTLGGVATAGPSSALSQSDAASAGVLTGVTGRRL